MSTDSHQEAGKLSLRPRARLLRTFGNELISNESVAIIELVKNSYDADANGVIIRFDGQLSLGQGCIEVIDNGHGMLIETILAAWMEPATSFKRGNTRSPKYKRRMTGEKGIGRFASSKLANTLEVISRKEGQDKESRVLFDWREYDDESKYLDEIESLWEVGTPTEILPEGIFNQTWDEYQELPVEDWNHGTILRMTELKEVWTANKIRDLRTSLSRLIPPKLKSLDVPQVDDFHILLIVPDEFVDLSGPIGPSDILEKSPYEITGEIDSIGNFHLEGQMLGQPFEKNGTFVMRDNRVPSCGPLRIELRIWDLDATGITELARSFNSTQKNIREELNKVAGFNVYRDGFRVLPYGERHNDWLRLDVRRVNNPTLRLSNNQILGFVLISADENPQLLDQTNREGFVESIALNDLRDVLIRVLAEIEPKRWELRHPVKSSEEKKSKKGLFNQFGIDALGDAIKKRHADDSELQDLLKETEADLKEKVDEVQHVLARYHRLATLGTLVDTILHDGRAPLSKVKNEAALARKALQKSRPSDSEKLSTISDSIEIIEMQSESLATVFRRLEPFAGRKRGRPVKNILENIIRNAFGVLESEITQLGVEVILPSTETHVTVDSPEIQEVIINLLSNSLYWLGEIPKEDRKIVVEVTRPIPASVEILFSDSGPGVQIDSRHLIFEPYFSRKLDGVGLGLAISGEIVKDYYDGDLELCDSGPLSGATFRVTLNKRV